MREIIKMVITHFFVITVSVLFVESVLNLFLNDIDYDAYYPWKVMLTGFVGAIPSFLFYFKKEPTKKQFLIRIIIHFILIETSIMLLGILFDWYNTFWGGLIIFAAIFLVYAFVWFFSIRMNTSMADDINSALEKINRDE